MRSKREGRGKGKSTVTNHDPFFSRKRRKTDEVMNLDAEIESDDDFGGEEDGASDEGNARNAEEQEEEETKDEKRKRIAGQYLKKVREISRREKEEGSEEDGDDDRGEKEGLRDSLVAHLLKQEHLEESGRVRRVIASKVQKPEDYVEFRLLVKHRHPVTAVALSEDDIRGYSASKDGTIMHWDVNNGKSDKYRWPSDEILKSHGMNEPKGRLIKHSKSVSTLAVSSDGRYLATGGLDRHVHLWDTRTREHVQAFPGHRGPVSCLAFRQGTSELFSGSFDRTIKIWNSEDRTYMSTLFGHQSEVLTIDCLHKERVLTVGRDRTMQLFKVHDESRLVFRAPASSLECCCFISNDEFLSGSDDGSLEFWNAVRKKPVYIARNAHGLLSKDESIDKKELQPVNGGVPNGNLENGDILPKSSSSTVYSWISSIAVCRNSDLAASGAGNGSVRLWAIESETRNIRPLYDAKLAGFVNSLAFAKSGEFLVAGIGKEPRLGRWGQAVAAQNGVAIHSLKLSLDD